MPLFNPNTWKIKKSTIAKEIVKIKKDPDAAFVILRKGTITIVTQDIKEYGKYIIDINTNFINGNNISITNAYLREEIHKYQHLHIGYPCVRPCWGNIESDVLKYHKIKRYHIIFMLIMELLRSFKKEKRGYYNNRRNFKKVIENFKKDMEVIDIFIDI